MRQIDLWFVCLQCWTAVLWHKLGGPIWLALLVIAFLLCGMVYIWRKRNGR